MIYLKKIKLKNRRVAVQYHSDTNTFVFVFKRLADKGEIVTPDSCTVVNGRVIKTVITLSEDAAKSIAVMVFMTTDEAKLEKKLPSDVQWCNINS